MHGSIAHINLARSFRGGERQTELLVLGLAERGYAQRLIARAGAPLAQRLEHVAALDLRPVRGLSGALRACGGDPALVHVHEGRAPLLAWCARLAGGPPYVITRRVSATPKRNPVTRHIYRQAARVVAISRAVAAVMHAYDPVLRLEVIPSALAQLSARPDVVAALRWRYAGRFVVGLVGALVDRHKGQSLLLEVARRLASSHPHLHFVLVGDGPDAARLRARSAGLPNVELTGHVEDVGSYLAAFDLVALPSLHEGLGSVLLDAMDQGRAIVAARVGGIPELVADGVNGLLVAPGSVEELQRAILALYDDRARLSAMGRRGRLRARSHTPTRMVERYVQLYRSAQQEVRA